MQVPEARLTSGLNLSSAVDLAGRSDRVMMISLVSEDCIPEFDRMRGLIAAGLNALPRGANITVSRVPQRPPERMLGVNSTLSKNSTVLFNATYAVPAL